jgi:hypothetical protein
MFGVKNSAKRCPAWSGVGYDCRNGELDSVDVMIAVSDGAISTEALVIRHLRIIECVPIKPFYRRNVCKSGPPGSN